MTWLWDFGSWLLGHCFTSFFAFRRHCQKSWVVALIAFDLSKFPSGVSEQSTWHSFSDPASCLIYHWKTCSSLFATRCVLYLKSNCVPTCFFYVEQSQFFHSFRKLCFLKHLALISLLWTLSICFLSFLNCSTQIYTQHCSWIVSTAESSCQLLSCWRKLY